MSNLICSIAIIEDDADLRSNLSVLLRSQGYRVWEAESAEDFYRRFAITRAEIIIADLGLPGEDGLALIRHLRPLEGQGLIMLTAHGDSTNRIAAFEAGADMFLTKPVNPDELLAVLKSVERRCGDLVNARTGEADCWQLDLTTATLTTPDDRTVSLTSRELRLLECLMTSPGEMIGKHEIMTALSYGRPADNFPAVATLLSRLRKKLETELGMGLPVRAVFGHGLTFSAPARLALAPPRKPAEVPQPYTCNAVKKCKDL